MSISFAQSRHALDDLDCLSFDNPDKLWNDDGSQVDFFQGKQCIEGELHIVVHPVYQIPCPFLRLWNKSTGEMLNSDQVNDLMSTSFTVPPTSSVSFQEQTTFNDYRLNESGKWYPDFHCYDHFQSYLTLHLCEIQKQLLQISSASTFSSDNTISLKTRNMLVSWWSLVGPYCGMKLLPHYFQSLVDCLNEVDLIVDRETSKLGVAL